MRKIIFEIIFVISALSVYAIPVEKLKIEGADFSVIGYPDARINQISRENTIKTSGHLFFMNRDWNWSYALNRNELPEILLGTKYYMLEVGKAYEYKFHSDGEILAIATVISSLDRTTVLNKLGFERINQIKPFKMITDLEGDKVGIFRKRVKRGEILKCPAPWVIIVGLNRPDYSVSGETLYNGIILPRQWPPRYEFKGGFIPDRRQVMPVPYLEKKPKLIDISVGRQLFVDDFLIAKGDFEREFYLPKKYRGNPIFKPETPLEKGEVPPNHFSRRVAKFERTAACAVPVSGGLWWNDEIQAYQMWYHAGWLHTMAYATTKDFKKWERPNVNRFKEPNQIFPSGINLDSGAVFYDRNEIDPDKVYKNFNRGGFDHNHARLWVSDSATNFDFEKYTACGMSGDRSNVFYNPFRKKWVYSLRWNSYCRHCAYLECDDLIEGAKWAPDEPVYWMNVDKNDLPDPNIKLAPKTLSPQLYTMHSIAYESLMLGFMMVWVGPENDLCIQNSHPKNTGIKFAYSRDGFHYSRPDYRFAIPYENKEGKWDRGYIQPVNGGLVVDDKKIYIFYIGFAGGKDPIKKDNPADYNWGEICASSGMHGEGSLGMATLRRDGFASINSKKDTKLAEILTEPLKFSGEHLFVNIDAPEGSLSAEVLDVNGKVIQPFSLENCISAKGNSTRTQIKWKGAKSLGRLAHKPVRFRFKLENGKFYSFWVSVSENGRSDGYVGAGSAKHPMGIDTVGSGE